MEQTLNILNEINWFLIPIREFILFVFTSSFGIMTFLSAIILYILSSIKNEFKTRELLHKTADKDNEIPSFSVAERLYILFGVLGRIASKLLLNLPAILGVVIFLTMVVGFSKGISSIDEYVRNEKQIKELEVVLKHLNKRHKVAEVKVETIDKEKKTLELTIQFFSQSEQGKAAGEQKLTLKGTEFYIDSKVLNFEYSQIETGKQTNIAVPYRIFSEEIPMAEGIPLEYFDKDSIPYSFRRVAKDVYGMEISNYNLRINELQKYFTNPDLAKIKGIRSFIGAAVHITPTEGKTYEILVEQTGGIVLRPKEYF